MASREGIVVSANAPAPPGVETWQAAYLRLTVFPVEPPYGIHQNWWQELTGAEATEVAENRQQREKTESGDFDGINLLLNTNLLQTQWTAQMVFNPLEIADTLPAIGPFPARRDWFRDLMQQWLPTVPPLRRIAFSGRLEQGVSNHAEGYRRLDQYLRCVDLNPDSSDFIYRINRPRPSGTNTPDLVINRLSTWVLRKLTLKTNASSPAMEPPQVARLELYASSVEFDINTVPGYSGEALPQTALPDIFSELVDCATEIATHGDRP
jgi:hypothetical protein